MLCERGENVMGKECFVKEEKMLWEKNASDWYFILIPQDFHRSSLTRLLKRRIVW